jgi:ribosome-associated protein
LTDPKPSKSARKREAQSFKDLGEQLLALGDDEFRGLELDERVVDAVEAARRIRSREALRRQKQYIAKLLMSVDTTAIREFVERREARARRHNQHFQAAERWRDRLARDRQSALDEFEAASGGPSPEVRDLVTALGRVSSDREEKGVRKALFRAVFDALADRYDASLADAADDR